MTSSSGSPAALLFLFFCAIAAFVFYSYCLKRVVEKCGETPGGIIWVPILQMIPLFRIAKMNTWLVLLLCVPVANLIVMIFLWLAVLKVLGRESYMVLVMLFFGFIYLPVLAFSSDRKVPATA